MPGMRDKIRIYSVYILPEKNAPADGAEADLHADDIELVESGSDFSVFLLHLGWPVFNNMRRLACVFVAVIASLALLNVYTSVLYGTPELSPYFTGAYLLFVLTVAAFGNDWKRESLLRKGYVYSGKVCAVNRARALEHYFNRG